MEQKANIHAFLAGFGLIKKKKAGIEKNMLVDAKPSNST